MVKPEARSRSLRVKTLFLVLVATAALVLGICVPLRAHVLSRFAAIEERLAGDDLDGVRNTLQAEAEALGANARDYAVWDETYAFLGGENPDYVVNNFEDSTFSQNRFGLVVIVDQELAPAFSQRFDLSSETRSPPLATGELFRGPGDALAVAGRAATTFGLLRTSAGLYVLGAHEVVTSTGAGPPRGTLIIGRALDPAEVERLAERVRQHLHVHLLDDDLPADLSEHLDEVRALDDGERLLRPIDDGTLGAYALLRDVRGEPVAVLRILIPRTVYTEGRSDANVIAVSVGFACLAFGLLMLLLLERVIVRRVTHLGREVGEVGAAADHSLRVSVSGSDELGKLARTVNEMLDSLERLNTELDSERAKGERLLLNVLPGPIAERLKRGEESIADAFAEVSVLFADIVGFTDLSSRMPAAELVVLLNEIFSSFDALADAHGLEKIKTIGDAYMVVAGLPEPRDDHAVALSEMALDMLDTIAAFNVRHGTTLGIRIGVNTGPVVAGVIGKRKFIYDLWGDAVNIASRMESSGVPGRVQISESTFHKIEGQLPVEARGVITVKGKGEMRTWLLAERAAKAPSAEPT